MFYKGIIISPSILAADFSCLRDELRVIEESGADRVHLDVMDGHFVPNITFGAQVIRALRPHSSLHFEVHLMVSNPDLLFQSYIQAGADSLIFHLESLIHAHGLLLRIKESAVSCGVSIVPSTPVSACFELLPFLDQLLVMTVNPGFGGQNFIEQCREKIDDLAQIRKAKSYSYLISVDGGVNLKTAPRVVESGADILVTGNAFFSAHNKSLFVSQLRGEKVV